MNKRLVRVNVFLAVAISTMGVSGCAVTNATKTVAAKPKPKHEYMVISRGEKTAGDASQRKAEQKVAQAQAARPGKDKYHQEYERKRLWYNKQWAAKREAERRAKRDEYQRRFQQAQAQKNAAQLAQQQQRIPHYGFNAGQQHAQATPAKRIHRANQHQQRQYRQSMARSRRANVNLADHLSRAAIARTYHKVRYDGRYIPISYPMGDVPSNIGVCTDTVIRSYRRLGIDLQRLVHEDISRAFHAYPNLPKWGLSAPDPNIDHRRVHNLKVFFSRHGQRLPVTNNPLHYRPGDLVTWHLGGDQEHIGIVVNRRSPADPRRYMIVHNVADGDKLEDVLFKWPITGHFRYLPNRPQPLFASR